MRISGQGISPVKDQSRLNAETAVSDTDRRPAESSKIELKRSAGSGQPTGTGEATEKDVQDLTGNPNTDAYDPRVAAKAIREGTTYNKAVDNTNYFNVSFGIPEPVEPVRELPWETADVNARVDQLMQEDGLSFDAAVVIAMTDRPDSNGGVLSAIVDIGLDIAGRQPIEAGWEESFAQMVSDSSVEISAWAASQPAASTATFGAGADNITVSMRDGMVVVSDGTTEQVFDPADHDRIVIAGGSGNDTITVDDDVMAKLMIVGGNGDDTVVGGNGGNIIIGGNGNDNLEGGSSRDLIIGGAGRDSVYGAGGADIIAGGADGDALYGGSGRDFIIGGNGDDYIDGGRGNDTLRGDAGSDTISGGYGRDKIRGGNGADTLIGASGTDLYYDAESGDTVIAESDEDIDANGATVRRVEVDNDAGRDAVSIDPTSRQRFNDRVEDDLQTLRALESGQAMLDGLDAEFDASGHTTVIQEFNDENGSAQSLGSGRFLQADGTRGSGTSTIINYNPHYNSSSHPTPKVPIAVLFHEFAHAHHNATGQTVDGTYTAPDAADPDNGLNLRELQAAGIRIDHDNDPSTPDQFVNASGHPFQLTENGIREELGLASRDQYRS